jgi:rfaE bifunctional protein kinase chain/domain
MTLHQDSISALAAIKDSTFGRNKVVFVSGNFNILHPGHLRLLRFASECGDFLVVSVNSDQASGTLLPENLRHESIKSVSWVDFSFILRDQPEEFIKRLQPAVVVKGKEHETRFNAEIDVIKNYGGKLLFGSGDTIFSSIDLLRQEFQRLNFSTIAKPQDFPQRHGFTMGDLMAAVDRMNSLKVCILGDTIVDEYIACDALGMSQEDPTLVVTPIVRDKFIGGAAIVAAHANGLGANVRFFSVVGEDKTADIVRDRLEEYGVDAKLYVDDSRPTTLKQRFRAEEKTLLRVNHLRNHPIRKELQQQIIDDVEATLADTDLLIFSDFNYGCLPQAVVDSVVSACSKRNIMMSADSQSSSQVGDVSRFRGMELLSPTEREVRLAVRDFESGLVILAESLRQRALTRNILITLGAEGVLIHAATSEKNQWLTDRLPAFNMTPKDVAGAGDSMLICASMAMAVGCDIWQSVYLGSLSAACQTGRLGNVPLSSQDLKTELMS